MVRNGMLTARWHGSLPCYQGWQPGCNNLLLAQHYHSSPQLPLPLPASPQFHLNRAGVWGVALLRVLASGEWGIAVSICLVLLLPAITHTLPLRLYTRCVDMHVLVGSAH